MQAGRSLGGRREGPCWRVRWGSLVGRGAAWSWKELQEPRLRCHYQCRGRVLGKQKRLAGWPSFRGPLRHPEKSEIIEEEQEEEEKGWHAVAKSLQSCPTVCDPMDGSLPGSPIPGILQARTLQH